MTHDYRIQVRQIEPARTHHRIDHVLDLSRPRNRSNINDRSAQVSTRDVIADDVLGDVPLPGLVNSYRIDGLPPSLRNRDLSNGCPESVNPVKSGR